MNNPEKLATYGKQDDEEQKAKTKTKTQHNNGNNKITELRTILQRESENS